MTQPLRPQARERIKQAQPHINDEILDRYDTLHSIEHSPYQTTADAVELHELLLMMSCPSRLTRAQLIWVKVRSWWRNRFG